MKDYEKISKIFFSPSGTTQKIVNEVSKNFDLKSENYDLMSFDEKKEFGDELVIIGVPVFDGRIPKLASERLRKLRGNKTKAIVILNYGNINYGDALLELTEKLTENNFQIIAIATTVSNHSIFNNIAQNRPDEHDLRQIREFSNEIIEKLKMNKENQLFVSGTKPYPDYTKLDYTLNCDEELCTECLDCAYTCPEGAISEDYPMTTNLEICSRCSSCIQICPEDARSFVGESFEMANQKAIDNFQDRKEPEFYL